MTKISCHHSFTDYALSGQCFAMEAIPRLADYLPLASALCKLCAGAALPRGVHHRAAK